MSAIKVAITFVFGFAMLCLGVLNLRRRSWRNGVPALELLIDRAVGAEPPDRTVWDRRLAWFHGVAMIVFGLFFLSVGTIGAVLFYSE